MNKHPFYKSLQIRYSSQQIQRTGYAKDRSFLSIYDRNHRKSTILKEICICQSPPPSLLDSYAFWLLFSWRFMFYFLGNQETEPWRTWYQKFYTGQMPPALLCMQTQPMRNPCTLLRSKLEIKRLDLANHI